MLDEETIVAAETACQAAGYETRRVPLKAFRDTGESDDSDCLLIGIPNGRLIRWNEITSDYVMRAIPVAGVPEATALGDYEALLYKDTCEIEAGLDPLAGPAGSFALGSEFKRLAARAAEGGAPCDPVRDSWALELAADAGQKWSAEISPCSSRFNILRYARVSATLKIRGAAASGRHDEALKLLEEIGQAILFELDLRYGLAACLSKIPWRTQLFRTKREEKRPKDIRFIPIPREMSAGMPSLPENAYPSDPLALYWHARSAAGMPLIQYLASYQVLEYYFHVYYEREIIDRIKEELAYARLAEQSDMHVSRIIRIARSEGKPYGSERDQLRATVRGCVANAALEEYLSDDLRRDFFAGKQPINGVPRIDSGDKSKDLRDQVSDRIYDIRCRIVHAKSGSHDQFPELILPFSPEADALMLDIELIQYLARRVLISSAAPLRVPLCPALVPALPVKATRMAAHHRSPASTGCGDPAMPLPGCSRYRPFAGSTLARPVVRRQPGESAVVSENLEAFVIEKTLRVPAPVGPAGNGETAARQFDVVL